jgi:hypothetical protein
MTREELFPAETLGSERVPLTASLRAGMRRRSTRTRALVALVALVVLLALAYVVATRAVFTPERTVEAYLRALDDADAQAALALASEDALAGVDRTLLVDDALRGNRPAVEVLGSRRDGEQAVVEVRTEGSETFELRLVGEGRVGGVFPRWRVATPFGSLVPQVGGAPLATSEGVRVNGIAVAEPAAGITTFPGRYRVALLAGYPLVPDAVTVDVPAGAPVPVEMPVEVDPGIHAKTQRAVNDYVDSCASYPRPIPGGCPFAYEDWRDTVAVRWRIQSYPTVSVEVGEGARTLQVVTSSPGVVSFAAEKLPERRPLAEVFDYEVTGTIEVDGSTNVFFVPPRRRPAT